MCNCYFGLLIFVIILFGSQQTICLTCNNDQIIYGAYGFWFVCLKWNSCLRVLFDFVFHNCEIDNASMKITLINAAMIVTKYKMWN